MTSRKISITQIYKASKELESLIRHANRKITETKILLSKWNIQNNESDVKSEPEIYSISDLRKKYTSK
jgi:hypothetical protein